MRPVDLDADVDLAAITLHTPSAPRAYRLGLDAIAAAPLRAGVRVVQKVTYFFALETGCNGA